jgi:hypothetical protein
MQDEQVIETLAPHTPQKALADGIRSRGVIRCCEHLDITCNRNLREAHPKRAIVITDEVCGSLSKCRGLPQLLCSPRVGGRSCQPDMDYSPRLQFDDEECKERAKEEICDWETRRRPRSLWHEWQEGGPFLSSSSSWCANSSHILLNGSLAHMDTQLEQFTTDPLRSQDAGSALPFP